MKIMKNNITNLLITAFCLLFTACAEDKGNYDYTKINDLQILGIPSDTSLAKLRTLVLKPEFKRSKGNTEEGFIYSWEFAGKEVSTTRDLNYEIPISMSAGGNDCRYVVTDTKTGMKFYQSFNLNVVSEFSWGYYFLCEGENKQSILSYWNIEKGTTECIHTTKIGDYDLGSEPKKLVGNFEWIGGLRGYFYKMTILSAKSDSPAIITDNGAFMPQKLITTASCIYPDMLFQPSDVLTLNNGQYYLTENKVCLYWNDLIYRHGIHDKEYKWSNIANTIYNDNYIYAFDEISRKYYVLKKQINDPANGLIRDSYALDRVVEIKDQPDYSNSAVIGKFASSSGIKVFLSDNAGVRFLEISYADNSEKGECKSNTFLPIEGGVSNNSILLSHNNNWYVSANNKIFISPVLLPIFQEWITLPSELGEISAMTPSGAGKKIVVTMHNSNATTAKKGSFVIIDILTKTYEVHANMIDKCVSIGAFNADPYGQGTGDKQ